MPERVSGKHNGKDILPGGNDKSARQLESSMRVQASGEKIYNVLDWQAIQCVSDFIMLSISFSCRLLSVSTREVKWRVGLKVPFRAKVEGRFSNDMVESNRSSSTVRYGMIRIEPARTDER